MLSNRSEKHNHFDGHYYKKRHIAFVQNHMNSPTYLNLEQIKKRVVHVARDIFIFQEDNATVHITEHP